MCISCGTATGDDPRSGWPRPDFIHRPGAMGELGQAVLRRSTGGDVTVGQDLLTITIA